MEKNGQPTFSTSQRLPSSLLVVGALNRRVSRIAQGLPRCLHPQTIRAAGLSLEDDRLGRRIGLRVHPHWETLDIMPPELARTLGVRRQTTLDQIPWLPFRTPARQDPIGAMGRKTPPRVGAKPGLRLVASD